MFEEERTAIARAEEELANSLEAYATEQADLVSSFLLRQARLTVRFQADVAGEIEDMSEFKRAATEAAHTSGENAREWVLSLDESQLLERFYEDRGSLDHAMGSADIMRVCAPFTRLMSNFGFTSNLDGSVTSVPIPNWYYYAENGTRNHAVSSTVRTPDPAPVRDAVRKRSSARTALTRAEDDYEEQVQVDRWDSA